LPLPPHVPERQTIDYEGHGTAALFAAFDKLSGNVTGGCGNRHTAKGLESFARELIKRVKKQGKA
jgi:hypothetical protein